MKVLITGSSRGIGLDLTLKALEQKYQVLAVARNPEKSEGLKKLSAQYSHQLKVVTADLGESKSFAKIADAVAAWGSLDLLINNAGIYMKGTTEADFAESFKVNTTAPFLLTQALLPHLQRGQNPKVISISSKMGSIKDNESGGSYAYRASKTALNMINKSLAKDHPWLTAIVVHPGWVQTEMGGAGATVKIPDSTAGIWKVIHGATAKNSGEFIDYGGKSIAW